MPRRLKLLATLTPALALLGFACLGLPGSAEAAPPAFPGVRIVDAYAGQTFGEPLHVTSDGTESLYVVHQPGQIFKIAKWRGGEVPQKALWLDLSRLCLAEKQGGVLGLAFHPQYASNGRFFVSYTARNQGNRQLPVKLVIAGFRAQGGRVDPASHTPLLEVPKKTTSHQAGSIAFGTDGLLYISTGDDLTKGEGGGTPQNPRSLLGKILRISVDTTSHGLPYGIPADNPWAANHASGQVRGEIFAYGFRNPWRISIDSQGRVWTTEPGTGGPESREWVSLVKKGGNYGWPYMEGSRQNAQPPAGFQPITPVFEYVRGNDPRGSAGIGGHIYEGARIPALRGKYVFGDYSRGEVYCIDIVATNGGVRGANQKLLGKVPNLAAIGEDADGELYFCDNTGGKVYTLAPQ